MGFDANRVQVVTFDSFSTLVDPISAASVLDGVVDDPSAVAEKWHSVAVQYATVSSIIDRYSPYFELHCDALDYLLRTRGVSIPQDEIRDLTQIYHELVPFDDVIGTFATLSETGRKPSILSNGNPEMLESLVVGLGIGPYIESYISAEEIEKFKPNSQLYRHAAAELDTPISAIAHVGAGWGDIMGSMHAGMQGIWLNRSSRPWPPFGPEPDLEIESLEEVADIFVK